MAVRLSLLGFVLALVYGCTSVPPGLALPDELDGTWWYAGGEPSEDKELHFSTWPESKLEIDARKGLWRSYRDESRTGRDALFLAARVTGIAGNVLRLQPASGRAFDVYWRLVEGRLEFWYGDAADWLKPRVIYVRR